MESPPSGNWILESLQADEREALFGVSTHKELKTGDTLYQPNARITDVYFPVTAVLSNIIVMLNGALVEIGTIGWEGMSAIQVILGAESLPWEMICQIKGVAYTMPVESFVTRMRENGEFVHRVRSYAVATFAMMGQSIACNRLHSIAQRCARWLLTTSDRARAEEFALTQEFLAIMLGVHRPAVTTAALALQDAGCIKYRHGRISITDRAGLETASCECYRISSDHLKRLVAASA